MNRIRYSWKRDRTAALIFIFSIIILIISGILLRAKINITFEIKWETWRDDLYNILSGLCLSAIAAAVFYFLVTQRTLYLSLPMRLVLVGDAIDNATGSINEYVSTYEKAIKKIPAGSEADKEGGGNHQPLPNEVTDLLSHLSKDIARDFNVISLNLDVLTDDIVKDISHLMKDKTYRKLEQDYLSREVPRDTIAIVAQLTAISSQVERIKDRIHSLSK